jgi:hypothetical protein
MIAIRTQEVRTMKTTNRTSLRKLIPSVLLCFTVYISLVSLAFILLELQGSLAGQAGASVVRLTAGG